MRIAVRIDDPETREAECGRWCAGPRACYLVFQLSMHLGHAAADSAQSVRRVISNNTLARARQKDEQIGTMGPIWACATQTAAPRDLPWDRQTWLFRGPNNQETPAARPGQGSWRPFGRLT